MPYYTGIGSRACRKLPHVMKVLFDIAVALSKQGYTVRSGGADGADTAFEMGAKERLVRSPKQLYDIYLPWPGFNNRSMTDTLNYHGNKPMVLDSMARDMAKGIHKHWDKLKPGAKQMHTRNIYQVLGGELIEPSDFLVCYAVTDDEGIPEGGTRTAWLLAKQYKVPCYNLYLPFDRLDFAEFLAVEFGIKIEINL